MKKRGRKGLLEEWTTPEKLLVIEGWARDGLINDQIAHNIGITAKTLYEWKNKSSEFSEALKRGKEVVDREVENALLKRALGSEYEEVTTEIIEQPDGSTRKHIKKVTKMVIPDTTAQIFWLKNRRPDKWRDRPEVADVTAIDKLDAILDGIKNTAQ